jgi:nucleoid-associated protein EbfC
LRPFHGRYLMKNKGCFIKFTAMNKDKTAFKSEFEEVSKKIEAIKSRLSTLFIDGESDNGTVVVTLTASRQVVNIAIDDTIMEDRVQLEEHLILALNNASEKITEINRVEMETAIRTGLLNITDLF